MEEQRNREIEKENLENKSNNDVNQGQFLNPTD